MSFTPYEHNSFFGYNPFGLLDQYFDNQSKLQLRDHAGKLNVSADGFSYKVDVSGFQPNEVKVDIHGDEVVIKGEHCVRGEHESVERSFVRRLRIPTNVHKESIAADIDKRGHLEITGKQVAAEQPQVRSIPINVKCAITDRSQQLKQ